MCRTFLTACLCGEEMSGGWIMRKRFLSLVVSIAVAVGMFSGFVLLSPDRVSAADPYVVGIVVTTTEDKVADDGLVSLREAIRDAVDGDTITFSLSLADPAYDSSAMKWTLPLTEGPIAFEKSITINGGGTIIIDGSANGSYSGLESLGDDSTLTLYGLEMNHFTMSYLGGAVCAWGDLVVTNCSFDNNEVDARGGAIYCKGFVTVTGSSFTGNRGGTGSAINSMEVGGLVSDCSFVDNDSDYGVVRLGSGVVLESTFSGNSQSNDGSAIRGDDLVVSGCTFVDNYSSTDGSSIFAYQNVQLIDNTFRNNKSPYSNPLSEVYVEGYLTIANCAFVNVSVQAKISLLALNSAFLHASDVAIVDTASTGTPTTTLLHCTIGNNAADFAVGTAASYQGMNCLFDNTGAGLAKNLYYPGAFGPNLEAFGYMLADCDTRFMGDAMPITAANLAAMNIPAEHTEGLADQGLTLLDILDVDQRGMVRDPLVCLFGSIEATAKTWVVNSTDDIAGDASHRTLRYCINQANMEYTSNIAIIAFDPAVFPTNTQTTIELNMELPEFDRMTIVNGPVQTEGSNRHQPAVRIHRQDGTAKYGIFFFRGQEWKMSMLHGLQIENGDLSGLGIKNIGGGVYSNTSLTMENCIVTGNRAFAGGGVYVKGLYANLVNCKFIDNETAVDNSSNSGNGGAVYTSDGTILTMTDCLIQGNNTLRNGGGVYAQGEAHFYACSFRVNRGGLYTESTAEIESCVFIDNYGSSGTAARLSSDASVENSIFSFNLSDQGALYLSNNSGKYWENENNTFYKNTGDDSVSSFASIYASYDIVVNDSVFVDNAAPGGASIASSEGITSSRNVFVGNSSEFGAACIYTENASSTPTQIIESVFYANKSIGNSPIIKSQGDVSITNSRITGNSGEGDLLQTPKGISMTNCIVTKNYTDNNISSISQNAYLYHTTFADNQCDAGIVMMNSDAKLYAYNSMIIGGMEPISGLESFGVLNSAGNSGKQTAGDSIIGHFDRLSMDDIFGANKVTANGDIYPKDGGPADKRAKPLTVSNITDDTFLTAAEIIALTQKDLRQAARDLPKVSYGALEIAGDAITKIEYQEDSLSKSPAAYKIGDALDLTDGVLNIHYNRLGTDTISLSDSEVTMLTTFDPNTVGEQIMSFSYYGETVAIPFTVSKYSPTLVLSVTAPQGQIGDVVSLVANLSNANPDNNNKTIHFYSADEYLSTTTTMGDGKASITMFPNAGDHVYFAVFEEDDTNLEARSNTVSYSVEKYSQTTPVFTDGTEMEKEYSHTTFMLPATGGESTTPGYIYSSLHPDIATIDPATGEVTMHHAGTATLTVYKPEDATYNDSSVATFELTINPKPLTATPIVNDKPYDGLTTATLDSVSLDGIEGVDDVSLENLTPYFADPNIEADKPIQFETTYYLGGADKGNYILNLPLAATASITPGFTPEQATHYTVTTPNGTNGWFKKNGDYIITAAPGFTLGFTDTDAGPWQDHFTYPMDTIGTDITFYVRNLNTNEISTAKTESYKKDSIAPDIGIPAGTPLSVKIGDPYTPPTATATDVGSGLSGTVQLLGSVDNTQAGVYTLTFTATDLAGNQTSTAITVTVEETEKNGLQQERDKAQEIIDDLGDLTDPDNPNIGEGKDQYPPEAVEDLKKAIEDADKIIQDPNATEEEVEQAIEDLKKAVEEFQKSKVVVDSTDLQDQITKAESLKAAQYTSASWAKLQTALAAAKAVIAKPAVTQAEIDKAFEALAAAIDGLVHLVPKTGEASDVTLRTLLICAAWVLGGTVILRTKKKKTR